MRQSLALALALAATTGCTPNELAFQHSAQLESPTRGFALHDDGETAQAGMFGSTCEIQIRDGSIWEDQDVEDEDDDVKDADADRALVIDSGSYTLYRPGEWDHGRTEVDGLVDARLSDAGIVSLADGADCVLAWEGASEVVLDGAYCDGAEIATDRRTGLTVVGSAAGAIAVTPDGLVTELGAGDLVAVDTGTDAIYVATRDGTELTAYELDGALRWSAPLAGTAVDLEAMGTAGDAALMTALADGTGEFLVFDALTGEVGSSMVTPTPARAVDVSANGQTLAMTLPSEVHFFDVR